MQKSIKPNVTMELATKTEYGKPDKVIVKWAENLTVLISGKIFVKLICNREESMGQ